MCEEVGLNSMPFDRVCREENVRVRLHSSSCVVCSSNIAVLQLHYVLAAGAYERAETNSKQELAAGLKHFAAKFVLNAIVGRALCITTLAYNINDGTQTLAVPAMSILLRT
jgi:hypothetical protein